MGNNRLTINLISNIISYSSTILISFVLTPYLINTLGKEAYSFYPLANNFVNFMGILTLALNSMANRFITIEIVNKNYDKANKYFSSVFFANVVMSFVLLLPMVITVIFLNQILNIPIDIEGSVKALFALTFISMIMNIVTSVFGVATFANNRIDLRSLNELIIALLRIILFVIFFSLFTTNIAFVGLVALILSCVNFAIQYFYSKKLLPNIRISREYFSRKHVKILLSSGIWNSINQLGNILLVSSSLLLVNIYYGASRAGQYSIVQTVPNFINGMISMLTGVFVPLITYRYATNDIPGLLYEIKKSQKIISFFSSSVIAVFIGLSFNFFELWVPAEDASLLEFFSTLTIIPHFIIGTVWPISNLNTVMNKVKIPSLFTLGFGLSNILINIIIYKLFARNFIVVPLISTTIQIVWVGIFIPIYACKILKISYFTFYPILIKTIISGFVIFSITKLVQNYIPINSWATFFLVGILCGGLALIINAFVIFGIRDIKNRVSLNK